MKQSKYLLTSIETAGIQQEPPSLPAASSAWELREPYQYPAFGYQVDHFAAFPRGDPDLGMPYPILPTPPVPFPVVAPPVGSMYHTPTNFGQQSQGRSDLDRLSQSMANTSLQSFDLGRRLGVGLGGVSHNGHGVGRGAIVPPRRFAPSTMKQQEDGLIPPRPPPSSGTKYRGDLTSFSYIRQIPDLPDRENCALFITGIPIAATPYDIFETIKTGAVVCLHIKCATELHRDKAAKLVFKVHEAAAEYLAKCESPRGVLIHGRRIKGVYNKHGVRKHPHPAQSRVLLVVGPVELMTRDFWDGYFRRWSKLTWDAFGPTDTPTPPGKEEWFFAFERIDGQSQTCLSALLEDDHIGPLVEAKYGPDPCEDDRTWFRATRKARHSLMQAGH